jgi:hypothetical protein
MNCCPSRGITGYETYMTKRICMAFWGHHSDGVESLIVLLKSHDIPSHLLDLAK